MKYQKPNQKGTVSLKTRIIPSKTKAIPLKTRITDALED